jgi:two-component system, OmpR family, sensor kinase ParS
VKQVLQNRNRRLLFRSYLVLAGGLLVIAIVLDLGFSQLQSREQPDVDRWLEATVQLVESQLAESLPEQRDAVAAALEEQLGVGVQLLGRDDVQMTQDSGHHLQALVDADGNTSYLHDAESIDAIIRLGPIAPPGDSLLLKLLPPLFYLSILVVVGLWLRPLLRDINVISRGAQRFAADYREPLSTAARTTELTALAKNLDEMAARLSGVLRSQKELIAALSHEMRTPLARIRFALAVVGNRDDEVLQRKLAAMNDDVQEIDDLVASMLNYARLDHPDIDMHWQAVPVTAWLEQMLNKARTEAIRITAVSADAPDKVWMDPRLMDLALSNLLGNACQYADKEVRCTIAKDANGFVLTVEDDGKGIPEEARDKVFKAFTRIDDSRNRETGGYGLGLAIVARVAELHGGTAEVDESPGLGGARLSIRWPVHAKHDI